LSDNEEYHRPQKKSRNTRCESNATNQSEYILIFALSSSSPPDTSDSWMVDSGASHHFSGYNDVLSNLVGRESSLKIILGDNSTHPVKVFESINFHLGSEESILLHDVMYMLGLNNNLVSISALEDKGMRVSFIKEKLLTWSMGTL